MAIRYAGIEFDTVEELVEYKRLMEGKTDKKVVVVHEQAKPVPTPHEFVGRIAKQRGGSKCKVTDEKIVDFIKGIKRKLTITRLWKKLGYKGGMLKFQKDRLEKLIADNNLQDRIKRRKQRGVVPSEKPMTDKPIPEKAVKYSHIEVNEKHRIRELCESGLSMKEIAKQTGRSYTAVYRLCSGLIKRLGKSDDSTTDRIIKCREQQGKSFAQIGRELGMSKAGVHHHYMKHRKPFVPQSYEQRCTQMAEKQTGYVPFPEIVMNNGMLRLTTLDLIRHHINGITAEYAEHFGIGKDKEWVDFLSSFMQQSSQIAKHFNVPNKFVLEQNKIVFRG